MLSQIPFNKQCIKINNAYLVIACITFVQLVLTTSRFKGGSSLHSAPHLGNVRSTSFETGSVHDHFALLNSSKYWQLSGMGSSYRLLSPSTKTSPTTAKNKRKVSLENSVDFFNGQTCVFSHNFTNIYIIAVLPSYRQDMLTLLLIGTERFT